MHEIQIEDEAYDWFLGRVELLETLFRKKPYQYEIEFILMVQKLHEDLLNTKHTADPKVVKPRKKREPSTKTALRDGCKTHPNYGAQRPPRTGCEGCWAAYKAYNPLKYPAAWRKHLRKQTDTTKD